MARRPSVFVRSLSIDEGRKLQRITRTSKDPVRMRRAIVVMMSGQGQTVRDITSLLQVSEDYVRDVIHAFNERGFDALDPKWSGGRSCIWVSHLLAMGMSIAGPLLGGGVARRWGQALTVILKMRVVRAPKAPWPPM